MCIGAVLPAPRVVIAILRDEAVATLSKALLVSVDEIIALMGHSFGGQGQSCRTPMLLAIPFSFQTQKRYVFPAYSFLLQVEFATLRTTPLTPMIDPTPTPKETSDSTLNVNISQNSQLSITGSLEPAQFAKGMRSDTPFRFTESRTPIVKVTKKSRRNLPLSTQQDVQLSESQLLPSRSPGHH